MEFAWKSYSDSRWEEECQALQSGPPLWAGNTESVGEFGVGVGAQGDRPSAGSAGRAPGWMVAVAPGHRGLGPGPGRQEPAASPEEALGPADSGLSTAPDGEVGGPFV